MIFKGALNGKVSNIQIYLVWKISNFGSEFERFFLAKLQQIYFSFRALLEINEELHPDLLFLLSDDGKAVKKSGDRISYFA